MKIKQIVVKMETGEDFCFTRLDSHFLFIGISNYGFASIGLSGDSTKDCFLLKMLDIQISKVIVDNNKII